MTVRKDRRRILGILAATGGAAIVSLPASGLFPARLPLQDALLGVLSDPGGARPIGRAYLDQAPWESNPRQLLNLILERSTWGHGDDATLEDTRAFLYQAVHDDFEQGRTVELNGWVVSRTEGRLCALACLAGRTLESRQ